VLGKLFQFCRRGTVPRCRSRAAVVLLLSLTLNSSGGASTTPPAPFPTAESTFADYWERAVATNPALRASIARRNAAAARVEQAGAPPDPMLSVSHFFESVQTRTGPQKNILNLQQRYPWFGTLGARKDSAIAAAASMRYASQSRELALKNDLAKAFYEYAFTGQALELVDENLALLEKLTPAVEEKVRTGGSLNALLRLQVEIGRVGDRFASLQQERVVQAARLSELLDLPMESLPPFPNWNSPAPVELGPDTQDISIAGNPALLAVGQRVVETNARAREARLAAYPDLTFGLNYIQVGDPTVNPNTPDAGRDPWALSLAVNLPIWFGKNDGLRAQALAERRASMEELRSQQLALQSEFTATVTRLRDANRRLVLYGEDLLGLAEQAVENSRTSYKAGIIDILEVIDSERSLLDLNLLYWRAAADARIQAIRLKTLTGNNGEYAASTAQPSPTP